MNDWLPVFHVDILISSRGLDDIANGCSWHSIKSLERIVILFYIGKGLWMSFGHVIAKRPKIIFTLVKEVE